VTASPPGATVFNPISDEDAPVPAMPDLGRSHSDRPKNGRYPVFPRLGEIAWCPSVPGQGICPARLRMRRARGPPRAREGRP
jgi:hypothetical protein